ncbi:MAG: ABC transporter permease [Gemmatimonadetes bacterium]|nr:ABC transporter permease [Gemmatimonadota bacterium]
MNRRVRAGLLLLAVLFASAALAPAISRHSPVDQPDVVRLQYAPPSWNHPLGTDFFSRDVLSRTLYGARISLSIACLSVLLSVTVGTMVGLGAGFAGSAVDAVLMRLVDAGLAIPRIFLLLVIAALWPRFSVTALILVLGLTSWFGTSRLVRAEVLSVRNREYVTASRVLGLGSSRIALRHVLPNVVAPILVAATLGVGNMILIEAGLSYLGFGVPQPTASLGNMIRDGQDALLRAPWVAITPGVFIIVTVLAFSVLSDGLRQASDPRSA